MPGRTACYRARLGRATGGIPVLEVGIGVAPAWTVRGPANTPFRCVRSSQSTMSHDVAESAKKEGKKADTGEQVARAIPRRAAEGGA